MRWKNVMFFSVNVYEAFDISAEQYSFFLHWYQVQK